MSYLQCTPAMIQVPCTGGATTHFLEAIGTERLAFKVKLKHKYYDLYKVSPPLGFVKPGVRKELFLRRLPGKPGKAKLVIEYIASPEGYDPRKPFVEGADVGVLNIRVRAYSDKKLPDKTPTIMGKVVTKAGQKFTPSVGYDDLKLETEIDQLFDKDKKAPTEQTPLKEKEMKEKSERESKEKVGKEVKGKAGKEVSEKVKKETKGKVEKGVSEKVQKEAKGKVEKEVSGKVRKESKEKVEKEVSGKVREESKEKVEKEVKGKGKGKIEKEGEEKEDSDSSEEDVTKKDKKEQVPIQVVLPNLWKDSSGYQMQRSSDELKAVLEIVTNENKRLEEVVKQMMQEITFLRESLLSTVLKLAESRTSVVPTSLAGAQMAVTAPTDTSVAVEKSSSAVSVSSSTTGACRTTSPIASASSSATSLGRTTSPVASAAGTATDAGHTTSSVASASGTATSVGRTTSTVTGSASTATGADRTTTPVVSATGAVTGVATGVGRTTSPVVSATGAGVGGGTGSTISGTGAATGVSRTETPVAVGIGGAKSAIGLDEGGILSQTGAGAEVEKYLSAMLAGGGTAVKAKEGDGGPSPDDGGIKEFSLYCPGFGGGGGGGGTGSAYMIASTPSAAKAKDVGFAFGNTADQLSKTARSSNSPGGSSGGFGSFGSGSGGGSPAYRSSSVYL
ncbi:unnamed protein product [Litomosoides sigmodontis]|uniref:MSP domain-containing protein n=1 Tax=Litomosoides sigmodontis TaxID=42156 RepID=A0A3P6UED0_LITSI|nr:unnamed protein product [Litomosoides sigmodontis]